MTAVFCACHQRSKIKGYHPFTEQYTRNFFLHNTQCKPFGNGGFSNARFADQDRIIFFSAAENLCNPFDLLLPAYNGVKFAVFAKLCEVSAEIVEHGCTRFFGTTFRFLGAPGVRSSTEHFRRFIVIILGFGSSQWIISLIFQQLLHHIVAYIKFVKNLCGEVIFITQYRKQKVFGADELVFKYFCFKVGDLQNFFRLFCKRYVGQVFHIMGSRSLCSLLH